MAEELTREQVLHVAKLSRLKLEEEDIASFSKQLSDILSYVDKLNELDTSDVEPLAHVLPVNNILRDDEPSPAMSVDDALANAPERDGPFFKVPKVLGEETGA
jgi:aspartyl-tRNA(Asn)/glutamyl-tRNA(Gln) amidotransferase subunit C